MANNISSKTNIERLEKGLVQDYAPIDQPKGSYPYMLNGINQTRDGVRQFPTNEEGNTNIGVAIGSTPGYIVIGHLFIGNGNTIIWSFQEYTAISEIGILNAANVYTTLVNTPVSVYGLNSLNFQANKQIDATFRIRRGNQRVIYWVDGYNVTRQLNIDNLFEYYTLAYQEAIINGTTLPAIQWNIEAFNLIKTYQSIPQFDSIQELSSGNIIPGSYAFAIQYLDKDLNPTNWVCESNSANIYTSGANLAFFRIRGSRNAQNNLQYWTATNKSIKLTIGNLDLNFPYYRIGIIPAINNDGLPVEAFISNPIATTTGIYIYDGDNSQLTKIPLADIAIDKQIIYAPKHIDQIENRLVLANSKDTPYNWCGFQQYASKISTDLVNKSVVLNSQFDESNPKNINSKFSSVGYMPGEVYSFGIVYLMGDYTLSPVFHIPGKAPGDNVVATMQIYECDDAYINTFDCASESYWGLDHNGNPLADQKIRQHKFPRRADCGLPLIIASGSSVTINNHSLSITFNLAGGHTYPVDTHGFPLVINANVFYKLTGDLTIYSFPINITQSSMGIPVLVYTGTIIPDTFTGGAYLVVDTTSQVQTYITSGTFTVTLGTPVVTTAEVVSDAVQGSLMGILFSNIQQPPGVIGFYIARIQRKDDDKLIIDNGIIGPAIEYQNYIAFSQMYPELYPQGFVPANAGTFNPYSQPQQISRQRGYLYFPEHQYANKQPQFDTLSVEGFYKFNQSYYPSSGANYVSVETDPYSVLGDRIPNVQSGAKYDTSGAGAGHQFDMIVSYKAITLNYFPGIAGGGGSIFPPHDVANVIYLNAASYIENDGSVYYNVACDTKIALLNLSDTILEAVLLDNPTPSIRNNYIVGIPERTPHPFDASLGDYYLYNKLAYVSLISNKTNLYANFQQRQYFIEHNNPIMFNAPTLNDIAIYNGDAYVSAMNPITSFYWDTKIPTPSKSKGVWEIVAGVVLLAAAVVLSFTGVGAIVGVAIGATVVTALTTLAIGYGMSFLVAGFEYERMQQMITTDYPNGLQQAITDLATMYSFGVAPPNESIRWYSAMLQNIWIESSVNMALRSGTTSTSTDFFDSPRPSIGLNYGEFIGYLTDKYTVVDQNQGSGRLYRGHPVAEFYDMNLDYIRETKTKIYYHLPADYNCCLGGTNSFPNRVFYSQQSFQEELSDNYDSFLPNNYKDIEGEHGQITDLIRLGPNLYVHCERGLWHLPRAYQERVTDDVLSYLGTGDVFAIPPTLIIDDDLGSAGSTTKWATIKIKEGILFVSQIEGRIYLYSGKLDEISTFGNKTWFKNNLPSNLARQFRQLTGIEFPNNNNPANPYGIGVHATYDSLYNRVIITKRDYVITQEYVSGNHGISSGITANAFQIIDSSVLVPSLLTHTLIFDIASNRFYIAVGTDNTPTSTYVPFPIGATDLLGARTAYPFQDTSWTLSFSLDDMEWITYHSYIPNVMFNTHENWFSVTQSGLLSEATSRAIWQHNSVGTYQTYYGVYKPFIFEYIALPNNLPSERYNARDFQTTRTLDSISLQVMARQYDAVSQTFLDVNDAFFTSVIFYNSRQCSGEQAIVNKDEFGATNLYLYYQTVDFSGSVFASRRERNWNINNIRDYAISPSSNFFTKSWLITQPQYPIDKVLNATNINLNKDWSQREIMRDKHLAIRLKYYNPDATYIQLTTNYILDDNKESPR